MKFIKNWNKKIGCDYFTTIRRFTEKKYEYYKKKISKVDDIWIDEILYKKAKLIQIKVLQLKDVDDFLLVLDTGSISYTEILKRFNLNSFDKVMVLLYESR